MGADAQVSDSIITMLYTYAVYSWRQIIKSNSNHSNGSPVLISVGGGSNSD